MKLGIETQLNPTIQARQRPRPRPRPRPRSINNWRFKADLRFAGRRPKWKTTKVKVNITEGLR